MDKPTATRSRRTEVTDDDPHWAAFWAAYPRKTSKGAARKAWSKAVRKVDSPEEIIRAAERVRSSLEDRKKNPRPGDHGQDPTQFVPYPATWLNREQWGDDVTEEKKQATGGRVLPPKANSADECKTHPGQWAHNCGGCRIDRIVGDK